VGKTEQQKAKPSSIVTEPVCVCSLSKFILPPIPPLEPAHAQASAADYIPSSW